MVARIKDLDPDKGTPWEKFPERKRIAAEMSAAGETIKRIAEALKVNRTTVWRWSIDPDWIEYVELLCDERHRQNFALTNDVYATSLRAIGTAVQNGDAQLALGFVRALLTFRKPPA